jgi:hypothetical protein
VRTERRQSFGSATRVLASLKVKKIVREHFFQSWTSEHWTCVNWISRNRIGRNQLHARSIVIYFYVFPTATLHHQLLSSSRKIRSNNQHIVQHKYFITTCWDFPLKFRLHKHNMIFNTFILFLTWPYFLAWPHLPHFFMFRLHILYKLEYDSKISRAGHSLLSSLFAIR